MPTRLENMIALYVVVIVVVVGGGGGRLVVVTVDFGLIEDHRQIEPDSREREEKVEYRHRYTFLF